MPPGRLPGTDVRVRRARRQDLARLTPLLGAAADRDRRVFRRLLADLGMDVYVAEDAAGALVGLVAVGYVRSVATGRTAALLDAARVLPGAGDGVLDGLLAVAATRARRRGCVALRTLDAVADGALHAALRARGWRDDPGLVQAIGTG